MAVFFNGRLWTSPATMSKVDDSAMYNANASTGNVLAIIGKSSGGKPFSALHFGSPDEAKAAGIDGESLKAIALAFDPSPQVPGPSEVVFIRVNPAVQAALALKDAANATVINLTSTDYGLRTNQIKVKIEAGSTTGKKVTTALGNDYYSADNVARNAFSIQYSGAATTANISVSNSAVTLVADAATTVIDLNAFQTIGQVVDRINAVAGFAASVLDGNSEKPALNGLDSLQAVDCKSAAVTVTANLQAIIDWLNSAGEGFVTAARPANVGTLPVNAPYTYLAGGSDGTVTNTEWQSAFDVLQTVDVQWLVPISASPSIWAMADTHASYMSNIGRMERRVIVGDATGVTDDAAIAAAKLLNSDRTSYTHLGIYDYDANGKLTLYPAYLAAAAIAGGFAGSNPGTPMTNKALKIRGIERNLRNPTDTDRLINGGVLCIENTAKGFKVVKSITTWLVNQNYNRVEVSTGVATDYVSRSVRDKLDDLRGAKGSPTLLSEAVSRTDTILKELAKSEAQGGMGVIVGDATNPAYKNITATLSGDVVTVSFECSPVIPANYIAVTIHTVPYSGSASA